MAHGHSVLPSSASDLGVVQIYAASGGNGAAGSGMWAWVEQTAMSDTHAGTSTTSRSTVYSVTKGTQS